MNIQRSDLRPKLKPSINNDVSKQYQIVVRENVLSAFIKTFTHPCRRKQLLIKILCSLFSFNKRV